jgi:hypothetical protein
LVRNSTIGVPVSQPDRPVTPDEVFGIDRYQFLISGINKTLWGRRASVPLVDPTERHQPISSGIYGESTILVTAGHKIGHSDPVGIRIAEKLGGIRLA